MARERLVLAYSGGLDTSVAIRWIQEKYDMDVIAMTVDVGHQGDIEGIRQRALEIGAVEAVVSDAKELFVKYFVWPALQGGAIYEGDYLLATALARPLQAWLLVETAEQYGATAVAHGCTGKGNDQVRFDVSIKALNPDLRIVAPVREWRLTRDEEIRWAEERGIPIPVTKESSYSVDQNLWGRSVEAGILEDPWAEPPDDVWEWTADPLTAPQEPAYVEIEFEQGIPVALDGERLDGVTLIERLSRLAGEHGVGRVDHIENRLVGIKSREVYEAPAGVVLYQAHRQLEKMVLSKEQARFKEIVASEYASMVYNGQWFTSLHQDLAAFITSSQRHVTGAVRVRLHKGTCRVVGRSAPDALYSHQLATYDTGDQFDHSAAEGFIALWGLPIRTQAERQQLHRPAERPRLTGSTTVE